MTQQNVAPVAQGAAASESLRQQAEQLSHAVAAFRLVSGDMLRAGVFPGRRIRPAQNFSPPSASFRVCLPTSQFP
jgi:hypothetical protein